MGFHNPTYSYDQLILQKTEECTDLKIENNKLKKLIASLLKEKKQLQKELNKWHQLLNQTKK